MRARVAVLIGLDLRSKTRPAQSTGGAPSWLEARPWIIRSAAVLVSACVGMGVVGSSSAGSPDPRPAGIDFRAVIEQVEHRASAEPITPDYPASDPVYVSARRDQLVPAVARGENSYLVVWQEDFWSDDLYASRVAFDGTVLDPAGIPISTNYRNRDAPAVASNGTDFLVVWDDSEIDSAGISGVRVAGDEYLVTWEHFGQNIYGARVTADGAVLDPAGIPISVDPNPQLNPSLSWNGTTFLVVWEDMRDSAQYRDIYGARVDANGVVLDPDGIHISTDVGAAGEFPSVAWNGVNHLVVWNTRGTGAQVWGTRVGANGQVLDPSGIQISPPGGTNLIASVASEGDRYLVAWNETIGGDVKGVRVSSTGVVLDTQAIPISVDPGRQLWAAVAWGGTDYLVAWSDERNLGVSEADIYATRVDPDGVVLDAHGFEVSHAANWQDEPSVAWDGSNYFAVWEDYRNGELDIYGARLDDWGRILDGTGIAISTAPGIQRLPDVAWTGENFLVVWEDRRTGQDIYGARVSPDGELLDPEGIPISAAAGNQRAPNVASNDISLVTWNDYRAGTSRADIYAARVADDGTVLDPAGLLLAADVGDSGGGDPDVAWGESTFLVVWSYVHGERMDIFGTQ